MKVVINRCFGGFGLSEAAYAEMGLPWDGFGYNFDEDENRADPRLVACVEKLGKAANGAVADLRVVEIPDGIEWEIEAFDGLEQVAERHRVWY